MTDTEWQGLAPGDVVICRGGQIFGIPAMNTICVVVHVDDVSGHAFDMNHIRLRQDDLVAEILLSPSPELSSMFILYDHKFWDIYR